MKVKNKKSKNKKKNKKKVEAQKKLNYFNFRKVEIIG